MCTTRRHGEMALPIITCMWHVIFTLSSVDHLDRAQLRKQKENDIDNISNSEQSNGDLEGPPSPKVLRSTVGGPLHDKTKCVWCMQGEDAKQPTRLSASCPESTQI